jgi:hypothetical protein
MSKFKNKIACLLSTDLCQFPKYNIYILACVCLLQYNILKCLCNYIKFYGLIDILREVSSVIG